MNHEKLKLSVLKMLYFENAITSVRMSRDLEALVFQKNKYAYKEALNAYSEVYDEIIRVRNQLDVVWSEQIDLFFIIKNYKNLDKPIII